MRRFIYLCLIVALLPWIVIGIVRESTDDDTKDHYFVRAIFDNASTLVAGEDVKVAGVPVGVISDLDITPDKKAAVTLRIDDEGFIPWKSDAKCKIGSQGLIGEKFVDCQPGSSSAEPLARIDEGDGKGERLLPIEQTSSPVDLDLLNDIMRLPYRERFAILLSEFGAGLAGRGEELNEVIHRANPALRETDEVLKILADQNRVLARLARDSDRVLGPLARERESFADFVVQANATGEASAERRGDLARSIHLLPGFLRELRPLMADLEDFTDQGTPLLTDLNAAAPALGRLIEAQGTLADASRESFPSLGDALERGRPALIEARPLIRDLGEFGRGGRTGRGEPGRPHEEPEPDRRDRAAERPHLLHHARQQRLRRSRPLPPRGPRDQRLLDLRARAEPGLPLDVLRPGRRDLVGEHPARGRERRPEHADGQGQRAAHRHPAPGPAREERPERRQAARAEPRGAAAALRAALAVGRPGRPGARLPAGW